MIDTIIAARRQLGPETVALDLVPADGTALPPFTAGAHVDVDLPGGLVRQYSLWSDPAQPGPYRIAVQREPDGRGGSKAVHALAEGARLRISAPRNRFPLAPDASRSILLAGGIGITPLLSMAQVLHRQGAEFTLHYCARSRDRAAFAGLLAATPFAHRVALHLDDGPAAQRLDLSTLALPPAPGTHLYLCGPAGFMAAVRAATAAWPAGSLHQEHFAAPDSPETALGATGDAAFEIELATTGQVLRVPPGESALQVLDAAGFDIPRSCEQGICGTCLTRVIAGTPDHRDHVLTDEERAAGDQIALCCSRARSPRLVLDL